MCSGRFSMPRSSFLIINQEVPTICLGRMAPSLSSYRKQRRTAAVKDAGAQRRTIIPPSGLGVRLSPAAFPAKSKSLSSMWRFLSTKHLTSEVRCFFGIWILGFGILPFPVSAADKITYQDHILPLVEANCSKCHNADKRKADLDLTSYQGALKGSGSGPVVLSGNVDGSKLWKALSHSEEPYMPPNRPKLDDKELDLFKKWIAGGLLENAGGKAVAASGPAVDLTLKPDAIGKPDGPPPMPNELPVEPVVHTPRSTAITGLASSPWAPLVAVAGQKQVLLYNTDTLELLAILPFNEPVSPSTAQPSKPATKDRSEEHTSEL